MRTVAQLLALAGIMAMSGEVYAEPRYAWLPAEKMFERLEQRFAPPPGFKRVPVERGSFAEWLRGLPLKPAGAQVLLHDGRLKERQDVHAATIDIDVGRRDLQQCADAIMRLRAEYLFSVGRLGDIAFNATSGEAMPFSRWARGERVKFAGNRLQWVDGNRADATHGALRAYLDLVFAYAGTYSLEKELATIADKNLAIGDIFIKGGFPGHAVIVVDVAVDSRGRKRFLLVQSFMPAQEMHVLKNPRASDATPWFEVAVGEMLVTPEWSFPPNSLRRFSVPR
jgi:hypothetical protein